MIKSPVAPLFSVSSSATFEGKIDEVLQCFSENLDQRFVKHGNVFDLGDWLQFFAFDVMGTMTFSKKYGFLDEGQDVGGMLGAIANFMKTVAPVSDSKFSSKRLTRQLTTIR
jgi:Cytochrome P450